MKKIFAIAMAAAMFATQANALTLKPGQVIESGSGEVKAAHETENGQRKLDADGVLVAGGMVVISLNGQVIEVPLNELAGKSKEQIAEIIGEAAVEQMEDLHDAAQAHVDEIIASGEIGGAVNAVGKSVDEIVAEIDADAVSGAVVGVASDAVANQIGEALGDFKTPEQACAEDGVC